MQLEGEWARADTFKVLRDICPKTDLNWQEIADQYGFDLESLDDPQGTVSITACYAIFEHVAEAIGDDALMFDLFNSLDMGRLSIFDYIFTCAPSLREGCKAWVRFWPIRTNAYRLIYEENETGGYLEWPLLEGRGEWRQSMFARAGWALQRMEFALNIKTVPALIELATPAPNCSAHFLEKYRGRIKFGAAHNRIYLPSGLLPRPLCRQDTHLYEIILNSAKMELAQFGQMESPLSRIANEVSANLSNGADSLPKIATRLGMSQRAVQRLLQKEGTSFRQLSEEIRRAAAERYLRDTDMPMKEIAFHLGFSELSTFSRAVKNWFGVSPKKVREAAEK